MCKQEKNTLDILLDHRIHQLKEHFNTCGVDVEVGHATTTAGISLVCPPKEVDCAKFMQSIAGPVLALTPEEQELVEAIRITRKQAIKIRYMDGYTEDALSAYAFDASEVANALRSGTPELSVLASDRAPEYNVETGDDYIMNLVCFKQTYYILIMDSKFSPALPFSYTCCDVHDNEYIRLKP